jgi:nicotinamide-nucleotide amidase
MNLRIIILSTGSELTTGKQTDTNSGWIANEISNLGHSVHKIIVVPDKPDLIKSEIKRIMDEKSESLIIITGGLGPTQDDHTLSIICELAGKDMVTFQKAYEKLMYISEHKDKQFQEILPVSLRQTKIPATSIPLENEAGLAPGFFIQLNSRVQLAALPGVPREMKVMFLNYFIPLFKRNYETREHTMFTKTLWGINESIFQERFIKNNKEILDKYNIEWGVTAKPGHIKVSFNSSNETGLDRIRQEIFQMYGEIISDDLYRDVHDLLISTKSTISTAESCTGGLIAKLITDMPGSSSYYYGSIVAYHNIIKNKFLGVKKETLDKFGAVSEEAASEMAIGIQTNFNTNYSISVTGIAGPSGGTAEKKVGLVYIGIKCNKEAPVIHRFDLNLGRDLFREYVANMSLFLLLKKLRKEADF